VDGKYTEPEPLPDAINTQAFEADVYVAPDESFLIFTAIGRPDEIVGVHPEYTRGDLYISFRRNGVWSPAQSLGSNINSAAADFAPSVSPDGKYFFFTSERGFATTTPLPKPLTYQELLTNLRSTFNGRGNIYQIDISALFGGAKAR
jgi:hypothetical protein